jgi:hypothetical protein
MHTLFTEHALKYRQILQERFRNFLSKSPNISLGQDTTKRLLAMDDLFAPIFKILPDNLAIDVLCTLLKVRGSTLAILHSRSTVEGPEGVGRTSLMLKLLGISIDYAPILPDPEEILAQGSLKIHRNIQRDIQLLTTDFAYITNLGEQLFVLPTASEPILGLWDIARHVYRMIEEDYQPGLRLTSKGRKILDALMRITPPEPILECYGRWEEPHTIDIAVILEISSTVSSPTLTSISEFEAARNALHRAFDSVLYLTTPFWERNRATHSQIVKRILESVSRLPKIYIIYIPMGIMHMYDKSKYLDDLFEQFALVIESDYGGISAENVRREGNDIRY